MFQLKDLIGDYEEPETLSGSYGENPIRPKKTSEWTLRQDPKRLTRMFTLHKEGSFNSFVTDLLELQSETGHHARITLQYPQVKVEVWTKVLMDITEVDLEWTEKADDIFGDNNG